jgi:hypothetical protein
LRDLVAVVGGRYSTELGIDLARGGCAIDSWALAATLFGTRISAAIAIRTYNVLAGAGVRTISDAGTLSWKKLVALLDEGGYVRYDYRTADRLHDLAAAVRALPGGRIASLGTMSEPRDLEAALDALPGWGSTTVRVFLRELRGVWPGAQPPLDDRTRWALAHLGVALRRSRRNDVEALEELAASAGLDARDVEAALVRLALAHRRNSSCEGGSACRVLACADTAQCAS